MTTNPLAIRSTGKKGRSDKDFLEFFAGIGLVGAGLEPSGWNCIYANDIDPKKKAIFARNFPHDQVYDERDVWETNAIAEQIAARPYLATASFPCIDLSLAGHWQGFKGKHSSSFFGFTKVLNSLRDRKPLLVMIENVTGFLTSSGGTDFQDACRELASLGYWLDAFVVDAKYFVPQSRPRVFVIGIHESVNSKLLVRQNSREFGDSWLQDLDRFPNIRPLSVTRLMRTTCLKTGWVLTPITPPPQAKYEIKKFLDTDEDQAWWNCEQTEKHYGMLSDLHRQIVDNHLGSGREVVGTAYRRKRHGSTKLEVRFDGVAGCLRTPRGGSARQIVVHVRSGKFRLRWMSPREYARLQGAPKFKLLENERQMLFGFGDAVCVPVITWIDKCVLTPIYDEISKVS